MGVNKVIAEISVSIMTTMAVSRFFKNDKQKKVSIFPINTFNVLVVSCLKTSVKNHILFCLF